MSCSVHASNALVVPRGEMTEHGGKAVVPGQRVGRSDEFELGDGVYKRDRHVHSSRAGVLHVTPPSSDGALPRIEVLHAASVSRVPQPGDEVTAKSPSGRVACIAAVNSTIVLEVGSAREGMACWSADADGAQVLKVNTRFATVDVICVGEEVQRERYRGIIRLQDVRATETDKLQIYTSFRPGDIVRAEVISLGDARSYYLSTAKNDHGVILAKSMSGAIMTPVSWEGMQCPKTKTIEPRKVARVR